MKLRCRFGHDDPQQAVLSVQHVEPQVSVGQVAWHAPAEQVWEDVQARVHDPQWRGSVWRFTQAPPQSVSPAAQVWTQALATQVWPAGQTVPQVPQLAGSVAVLVQTVALQAVLGARHWQVLALHTLSGTQAFPQAPQFAPLLARLTQVPVA